MFVAVAIILSFTRLNDVIMYPPAIAYLAFEGIKLSKWNSSLSPFQKPSQLFSSLPFEE